jgi:hypothetical protein
MERSAIYERINAIRDEQDQKWPRDERRKVMYSFAPPHIVLLEKQLEKLRDDWYASKSELVEGRFAVIAALAVRAMEEITPFKELNRGVEENATS